MKMDEIRELIQLMEQSNLEELEFEQEGMKLSLKKSLASTSSPDQQAGTSIQTENHVPANRAVEQAAKHDTRDVQEQDSDQLHKIVSPMVGTFYQAPSPEADPYVRPGDRVNANTVVCIVEAMKLMNEIEAEVEGEIVKVLVENGQLVEYGQPLFLVRK